MNMGDNLAYILGFFGAMIASYAGHKFTAIRDREKRKQELYTILLGRRDVLAQLYYSLASISLDIIRYKKMMTINEYKETNSFVVINYTRLLNMSDSLMITITKSEGDLLETLASVELVFKQSPNLGEQIAKIVKNKEDVKKIIEDKSKDLDAQIEKALINKESHQKIELILSQASEAVRLDIDEHLRYPISHLLEYLQQEIQTYRPWWTINR